MRHLLCELILKLTECCDSFNEDIKAIYSSICPEKKKKSRNGKCIEGNPMIPSKPIALHKSPSQPDA